MAISVDDESFEFVKKFEAAEEATTDARQRSELSRDYYDNKQWTDAEVAELKKRGQPVITDNVIAGKVNWLLGQEMGTRTDPKAYPRTPEHEQGAEAATDSVRFVCDNQEWNKKRSGVWKSMLIEGFGGVEVIHRMKGDEPEVMINRYEWDRLFYDPHSREEDFSDARYKGAVIWSDRDELKELFPEAGVKLDALMGAESVLGETYEDRPTSQIWGDGERNRIRVVLMHYIEGGVWKWVKFTHGFVFDSGDSEYYDEDGQSLCPLIMQSAYIDRENNRYSETLKMIDQQDEINKRRSKLLHFANSRQTMGLRGSVRSVAALKRELAKPDGHVEYDNMDDTNRPSFSMIPTTDMASSQFALLQEAKESIQGMGATEALMGSADGDSGRAVLAKQQGAMQGITPLNDKLHHFTRNVYEAIWQRVRQFWTHEKWIRITDDERNIRFVGLNRPVTVADHLKEQPPELVQEFHNRNGSHDGDPRLQQVVGVENQIEHLQVDIIMEEVPNTVTLEAETFEQIVNIDTAKGGILPIEMLIEASPLRSSVKTKILKHFEDQKAAEQQGGEQQGQVEQQVIQLEMADKQVDIEKKASDIRKSDATTVKTQVETQRLVLGF